MDEIRAICNDGDIVVIQRGIFVIVGVLYKMDGNEDKQFTITNWTIGCFFKPPCVVTCTLIQDREILTKIRISGHQSDNSNHNSRHWVSYLPNKLPISTTMKID